MAKKQPTIAAQQLLPPGKLMDLELATIAPSATNPRKRIDEASLNELAASIAQVGVMQPIVVHQNPDIGFDIICGERRYRAAYKAGLETIPAMVYPTLPEDLVFDLQITENLQRQDINPMEEADAFQEIVARRRGTPETIAQRLGKSTKYVYDRLALRRCVEPIQEAVREGRMAIGTAKKFAQLQKADQFNLLESIGDSMDAGRIEKATEALKLNLAEAPFDITDANLSPSAGPCTTCPKRSGCNRLLFDDVQAEDICFDKACYNTKVQSWLDRVIDEVAARPDCTEVRKLSARYHANEGSGLLGQNSFDRLSIEHKSTTWGVVVELPVWHQDKFKLGEFFKIKLTGEQPDEDDFEDDEDEDGDSEGGGISKLTGKKAHIDHDEELQKHVAAAIIDEYLKDSTISRPTRHLTILSFDRLSSRLQHLVMQKFGILVFEPEAGYGYSKAECEKIIDAIYAEHHPDGITGIANLLDMLDMLNIVADTYIDEDYFTDIDIVSWWKANEFNFDPRSLMVEYCKANNYELDGIWPEPEAETDPTDIDPIDTDEI